VADSASVLESASGSGNVLTNDSDKDGDTFTVTAVNGASGNVGVSVAGTYGHITIASNGAYTYNADNTAAIDAAATGAHLTDAFTYTANDAHGGTTTTTITVTLDRPPTSASDSSGAVESGAAATGNVLTNDSDKDGDTLTVTAVNGSAGNVGASLAGTYGHLTLGSNGSYSYVADNTSAIGGAATGSHPSDAFTYTASDGHGGTTSNTLTFAVDRPPSGTADAALVFAGTTKTGTAGQAGTGVLGNDTDKDGDTLSVSAVNGVGGNVGASVAGTYGHLTLNADGSYSYAADNAAAINAQPNNAPLTDAFTYSLSDGQGGSTTSVGLTFTVDQAPSVVSFNAAATSTADFTTAHAVTFTLTTGKIVTVAGGTTLALSDGGTATYVSGSGTQTVAFSYTTTQAPGALSDNSISAGSIADAAGNPIALAGTPVGTYSDAVTDTAAHVSAQFDNLNAVAAHITSITLTDGGTPDLALTATQALNDGALIGVIASPFHLVVTDTAAHVQGNIDALQADAAAITSVSFTDAGTPTVTITSAQQTGDAAILAKLQGPYDLLISDASGTTPEPGISGTAPHYHAVEYEYDPTTTLVRTIYFNDDGTETIVNAGNGQTIDDSASTTDDYFNLSAGSNVTATGGSGNDGFYFGANFTATDHVDGGAGSNNQIGLSGDYSGGLTLGATTITNIQVIACLPGFNYNLTTDDANVAAGATLTVWAVKLAPANTLTFNGSAETDGNFKVFGGAGNDVIQGGAGNDTFYGLGGADTLTGHGGSDTFVYTQVSDSNGTGGISYDTLDFTAGTDKIKLSAPVTAIDTAVAGTLSTVSFDGDLTAVLGNGQAHELDQGHAVIFTANAGTLNTHVFLVVGTAGAPAGYAAGQDYVFDVTAGSNFASLATSDFA
jgi:VCBS repeat-containing protein